MHYNMQSNTEKIQKGFSCQDQRNCRTLEEHDDQDQEDKEVVCHIDLTFQADELLSIPQ